MHAIVAAALKQRVLVIILGVTMMVGGLFAYRTLNIEAYPDPVPPLVDVITQNPGQSSEEIERYITMPIEIQMAGLPYVQAIRTISLFGLSDVKVQFTYDVSYQQASQHGDQPPDAARRRCPTARSRCMSPTSPIGEIFRYRVVGPPGYSVTDLKTIQDWILQRRFKAIPGVIDVTGWGGKTKTYDIIVDLDRLLAYGLTLKQVLDGLGNANINVGANTVNIGSQSAIVRSVGQIRSMDDIRNTMLSVHDGTPVLVSDVAKVTVGNQPRLGIAGQNDDDDIVQGIVLMRRGAETLPTLTARAGRGREDQQRRHAAARRAHRAHLRQERAGRHHHPHRAAQHGDGCRADLPDPVAVPGQSAQRADRLGDHPLRALVRRGGAGAERRIGQPAVDGRHRLRHHRRRHRHHGGEHLPPSLRGRSGRRRGRPADARRAHRQAGDDLSTPRPRSRRRSSSRPPSSSPASCRCSPCRVSRATSSGRWPGPTPTRCRAACWPPSPSRRRLPPCCCPRRSSRPRLGGARAAPLLREGPRFRAGAPAPHLLAAGLGAGAIAILAGSTIGLEFLPKLEEGNMWIRAVMPASISLEAGNDYANRMRRLIKSFPEAETVISQHGRPDDGTKSRLLQRRVLRAAEPARSMAQGNGQGKADRRHQRRPAEGFPGVEFTFSQYIQDNVQEAASGVKGENSVKVYGPDLETRPRWPTRSGTPCRRARHHRPRRVGLARPADDPHRHRPCQGGPLWLSPGDINATVQAAIGGQAAGDVYENGSDRHFPMIVRLAPRYRENIEAISASRSACRAATASPRCRSARWRASSRVGRLLHLSRAPGALLADEVQRGGRDLGSTIPGGSAADRRESQLPAGSGSTGSASSATSRTRCRAWRSPSPSPSR